jgi:hypothetical protein
MNKDQKPNHSEIRSFLTKGLKAQSLACSHCVVSTHMKVVLALQGANKKA